MTNPAASRAAASSSLGQLLAAYLDGAASIADVLAWEAELSLDARAAGPLRASLDRLSLVGAEVCDGLREESEFCALAREAVAYGLGAAPPALAVAETAPPYGDGSGP